MFVLLGSNEGKFLMLRFISSFVAAGTVEEELCMGVVRCPHILATECTFPMKIDRYNRFFLWLLQQIKNSISTSHLSTRQLRIKENNILDTHSSRPEHPGYMLNPVTFWHYLWYILFRKSDQTFPVTTVTMPVDSMLKKMHAIYQ